MDNPLRTGLKRYWRPEQLEKLARARVGIAGAGGLGSNLAMLLARSGIERMLIIDHDVVEPSNLNRQHYWPRHIGRPKVEALAESLLELNPQMIIETRRQKIDETSLEVLLPLCPIWAEALDNAHMKSLFVEKATQVADFVASASGLCGVGGQPLQKKRLGNLALAGDYRTDLDMANPYAPRVAQAAAIMADSILEYALEA